MICQLIKSIESKFLIFFIFVRITKRGCVKMMHPLFCYIIIGFSFFIESDFSFSVFLSNTHSSLWYNGL